MRSITRVVLTSTIWVIRCSVSTLRVLASCNQLSQSFKMSEASDTCSLNSSYDDDINTVVTSIGDCSTDTVFATVASYFDCGASGHTNSSLSKVRYVCTS